MFELFKRNNKPKDISPLCVPSAAYITRADGRIEWLYDEIGISKSNKIIHIPMDKKGNLVISPSKIIQL